MKRKASLAAVNRKLFEDEEPQSVEQQIAEANKLDKLRRNEILTLKANIEHSRIIRERKDKKYTEDELNEMRIQVYLDKDATDMTYFFMSRNYTADAAVVYAYYKLIVPKRGWRNDTK